MNELRKLLLVLTVVVLGAIAALPFQKGSRKDSPIGTASPEQIVLRRRVDLQIDRRVLSDRADITGAASRRWPSAAPSARPAVIRASGQTESSAPSSENTLPELSPRFQPFDEADMSVKPEQTGDSPPSVSPGIGTRLPRDTPRARMSNRGPQPHALRHRIVDGDTLEDLAYQYLGDRQFSLELFESNRDVLERPDLLPIGCEIKIPARPRSN